MPEREVRTDPVRTFRGIVGHELLNQAVEVADGVESDVGADHAPIVAKRQARMQAHEKYF